MNKNVYLILTILILSGCTVVVNEPVQQPTKTSAILEQLIDINAIAIGTSLEQVKATMGDNITIGHTIQSDGKSTPILVKSLQKEESLQIQGFSYQVLYYFTQIVNPDDQIAENELTPFVFEHGILISKTWDEFNKIKSKQ